MSSALKMYVVGTHKKHLINEVLESSQYVFVEK